VRRTSLVKIGGSLGIAATFIAVAVFVVACFRLEAVLILSPLPLLLGAVGLVLSVIGGVIRKHVHDEETQPIAAMFACITGVVLGTVELWIYIGGISSSVIGGK
jgi:hypothetical protein